jgi:hypothetical protein
LTLKIKTIMQTQDWLRQIDQTTRKAQEAFGTLTPEALNRQPAPGAWSIAQCLDHLMVTNLTYWPVVRQLRAGAYRTPWHGRFGFLTRFFGNIVLGSVQPDRRRKMKTFPIWEPAQSDLPGDIVARFASHQNELKDLIRSSEDLLAKGAVISSPANRIIVYKLATAFEIIVTHEERHLQQALEVGNR